MADLWTLPALEPMTAEEERDTIARAQAGDSRAAELLLLAYRGVMAAEVGRVRAVATERGSTEVDDLRSLATLGVLAAIRAFTPDKHARLAAIVRGHVRTALAEAEADALPVVIPARTLSRYRAVMREAGGDLARAATIAPTHSLAVATLHAIHDAHGTASLEAEADAAGGDLAVSPLVTGWTDERRTAAA